MPRPLSQDQIESFRGELCAVATRRFAEAGYEGVTLRGLAAELGVSPMTPYRYFENKEDIFEAVRDAAFERFGDHTLATEASSRQLPALEQLATMGRAYVAFALAEPHAYRIMFEIDHLVPDDPKIRGRRDRCWQPLIQVTTRCVDEGVLAGDPLTIGHCCWVTLHGLVTLHLSGKLEIERSLDDLLEPVLQMIIRGAAPTSLPVGVAP